ncbi:MAG: IS630 family transposase [Actinomycetota bacterium]|nr:IS630 family transposase [Actinomycetota bacterium]MDQ6947730.1 IS630 family transposase [Actinomycetota bacterium]
MAADGVENCEIARRLDTSAQMVHRWRKRFFETSRKVWRAWTTIVDPGVPGSFPPSVVVEVKQLACELPATTGVPLSRWSCAELAAEVITRGVVASISPATTWRILDSDAIRPWFHRMWISPRDPDFAAKAGVVLDLNGRVFDGQGLGPSEYVICADEKTTIHARCRCHPDPGARQSPPDAGGTRVRPGRGAGLLAAYDVHRAQVFGRCDDTTGIVPLGRLVEQVMTVEPYASRSGCSGWSTTAAPTEDKPASTASRANGTTCGSSTSPFTPRGSTRPKLCFSVVQRKVVNPNDFFDLAAIPARLAAFEKR